MKTPRIHRLPILCLAAMLAMCGVVSPSKAATYIKADNATVLETASSWLTNGIPATVGPTAGDLVVWDSTVSAANLSGAGSASNLSWGGIIISNPPGPVTITNLATARQILLNAQGLFLQGQDLTISNQVLVRSNQTWTINPGRSLYLAQGLDLDVNRNLTLAGTGTIYYGRNIDTVSNSVLTIPAGITVQSTNGTGIWRVGVGANQNGTNNQTGGTVIIRRSSATAAMQISVNTNSFSAYNLSGGTLDVRGIDDGVGNFNRTDTQVVTVGANSNISATINISGTGQMFADVINVVTGNNLNTVGAINATGGGQLTARNLILGTLGQATLTVANSAVVAVTNNLALAGFSAAESLIVGSGTINLDGGTLITGNMGRQAGTNLTGITNAIFNMNGGLLQIQRDNLNFSGANALGAYVGMFVRAGGARIDTAGFSITNYAPLLHGTGASVDAGLIKSGLGALMLPGTNTYNGPTAVNAGTLGLGTTHKGGGAITLANGTGLSVLVNETNTTVPVSTLTFGTGGATTLFIDAFTNGNPAVPVITATSLVTSGTITVNVAAAGNGLTVGQFPLIAYSGAIGGAGFAAFNLVGLPLGVTANLVNTGTSIALNVTDAPDAMKWNGNISGIWQVGGPANWIAIIGGGPLPFALGAPVLFDDTATGTTTISLNTNLIPGGFEVIFNNSTKIYSITGTGGFSGTFGLTKNGTGTVTLGTSNDYPFATTINAGTLKLGTNNVIPDGAGRAGLILNGSSTLDLNGFTDAVNGFDGTNTAIVNNSSASPATFVVGSNGVSGTFLGTIQNSGGGPLTLVKVGGGTNRFLAANTHTGGNIFRQGTTEITNGTALGSTTAPLSFGGTVRTFGNINNTAPTFEINAALTLNLSNNAAVTISGNLINTNDYNPTFSGSGSVTLTGSGTTGGFRPQTVALTTTGILTNTTDVLIGTGADAVASWVINGGRVTMEVPGNDFRVGNTLTATGTLHVTNNAQLYYEDFFIGFQDSATGRVYQSSGVISNLTTSGAEIRFAGNNVAAQTNTRATYELSGTARFYAGNVLSIGENGTAVMTLSGTAQAVAQGGATQIGRRTTNSAGTLNVGPGTTFTQATNALNVGNVGTGTLNIDGTVTVAPGNNLAIGVGTGGKGTVNLNPGGILNAPRIIDGTGDSTFNFQGGTLVATASSTDYMRAISNINVFAGNARINTGANAIGILPSLTDGDAGGGGLIKSGTGDLTLSGSNNTYTGVSQITAGRLFLTPGYLGASDITIADGAGFGVRMDASGAGITNTTTVTLGTGFGTTTFEFELGANGNPTNAAFTVPTINPQGTVTVNVKAGNLTPGIFTLIDYNSLGGSGYSSFFEGTLPRGVDADLVDNFSEGKVDLIVNSVDPIIWTGAANNLWDTNTINWELLGNPTAYVEGDSVLFNDSGNNTAINIVSNVSPLGIIVSNNVKTYTFSGPTNTGIIGLGGLTKRDVGLLIISSSNQYSGPTAILQGTVRFATNDVMPSGAGFGLVTVEGTLDVNGFNDTMMAFQGGGVISNGSPNPATLSFGANASGGNFTGQVLDNGLLTLRKISTGTNAFLTANPTWNGGITLAGTGAVAFSNDLALGVGTITFEVDSARLSPIGGVPRTLNNPIVGLENGIFDTTDGNLTLTSSSIVWTVDDMDKEGLNTLTLSSTAVVKLGESVELAVLGGSLIVDGATIVVTNDGFRLRATTNFNSVAATIQNNATITLLTNANLSLGNGANTNLLTPELTNRLTVTSGNITLAEGTIVVPSSIGNVGILDHNGGTIACSVINTNGLTICNSTNTLGTYNLNTGATLVVPRVRENDFTNELGNPAPSLANSTFVFGGGTLRASSSLMGTNFMSGLDTATVSAAGALIDSAAFDIDIAQPLAGPGGLTKLGSGTLALNAANTYAGATIVSAGVLRGKGSTPAGVSGAGRIGGGDSDELGTFTVNGNVTVLGGATLRVSHVGAVLSNDKVSATGSIAQAGQLTLIAVGVDFAVGDAFDLFDATGGISGGYTSYNLGLLPPGLSWDTTAVNTTGIVRIVRTTQVQTITKTGNVSTLSLGGVGPAASTGYRVLSTTNMAQPINLWTVYTNGVFDVNSNFSSVITVNTNDQRRFFIIINP